MAGPSSSVEKELSTVDALDDDTAQLEKLFMGETIQPQPALQTESTASEQPAVTIKASPPHSEIEETEQQPVKQEPDVEAPSTSFEHQISTISSMDGNEVSDEERRRARRELQRQAEEEERIQRQGLVASFSEDQLNRYEMYRRAAFPKSVVRRMMQQISGSTISQNVTIAMIGIAKVFVGDVVETGLDIKEKCGDVGPLQPKHVREAVRRLDKQSRTVVPRCATKRKAFYS